MIFTISYVLRPRREVPRKEEGRRESLKSEVEGGPFTIRPWPLL